MYSTLLCISLIICSSSFLAYGSESVPIPPMALGDDCGGLLVTPIPPLVDETLFEKDDCDQAILVYKKRRHNTLAISLASSQQQKESTSDEKLPNRRRTIYFCGDCCDYRDSLRVFKQHVISHIAKERPFLAPFSCRVCKFSSFYRPSIIRHLATAHKELTSKCTGYCIENENKKVALANHVNLKLKHYSERSGGERS